MAAQLSSLNLNTLRIFLAAMEEDGNATQPTDAEPHCAFTDKTAIGAITGVTNDSPVVITLVGHGLETGEYVVVDQVMGCYAANGRWQVDVLDEDTFSLVGSSGDGDWLSERGTPKAYLVLDGMHDLTPVAAPTAGTYIVNVPYNLPYARGESVYLWVWDEGPYEHEYFRYIPVTIG